MTNNTLLRIDEVKRRTGRSRSSIYADAQKGDFPKPIKIGNRATAWLEAEVNDWISRRVAISREGV